MSKASIDVRSVMRTTDWELLREQKSDLINSQPGTKDLEYAICGILNWIDAIQDAVVAEGIASEEEVFGN